LRHFEKWIRLIRIYKAYITPPLPLEAAAWLSYNTDREEVENTESSSFFTGRKETQRDLLGTF